MNSDMALSAAERLIFCSRTLHSHHHTCSILHTGTRLQTMKVVNQCKKTVKVIDIRQCDIVLPSGSVYP